MTRSISIENAGDFFRRKTFPKIRLEGRWLLAAGFPPGRKVSVVSSSPGVLELRLEDSECADRPVSR